jgi:hypothetical protein
VKQFLITLGIWFVSLFVLTLLFQALGYGRFGAFLWLGAFLVWSIFTLVRWSIRSDRREREDAQFADLVRSFDKG